MRCKVDLLLNLAQEYEMANCRAINLHSRYNYKHKFSFSLMHSLKILKDSYTRELRWKVFICRCVNSVNRVNSVLAAYSALLPPSLMFFLINSSVLAVSCIIALLHRNYILNSSSFWIKLVQFWVWLSWSERNERMHLEVVRCSTGMHRGRRRK